MHVESKENQNSLPKQHAETTALSQEAINKVESDDEKIVESKCQIEGNDDGTSASGKKENKNSLPNQHAETTAINDENLLLLKILKFNSLQHYSAFYQNDNITLTCIQLYYLIIHIDRYVNIHVYFSGSLLYSYPR